MTNRIKKRSFLDSLDFISDGERKYREAEKERIKQEKREYREANKEKIAVKAKEYYLDNQEERNKYTKAYHEQNKEKIKKQRKAYYDQNAEKLRAAKKEYYSKNKENLKQYFKENKDNINKRRREQRIADPILKIRQNLRSRITIIFNKIKMQKPANTKNLLGADYDIIKAHIEKQFANGMTWENYNYHTWHIDHIIPLASAKDLDELVALCHYSNLQPLWAEENIKKSDKIIKPLSS